MITSAQIPKKGHRAANLPTEQNRKKNFFFVFDSFYWSNISIFFYFASSFAVIILKKI